MADTLAQLFTAYAPPAADGSGAPPVLRAPHFLRLARDAGLLDNRFGYDDAAAICARAGGALSYSDFISALSEVATRKFGGGGGGGGDDSDTGAAEAFRTLLRLHVLPLHARRLAGGGKKGGGGAAAPPLSAGPGGAAFVAEFTAAPLQAFLEEQRDPLRAMFAEYAAVDGSGGVAASHSTAWAAVRDAGVGLGRRGLLQWANDYRVVPALLPRAALLALAKEVAASTA